MGLLAYSDTATIVPPVNVKVSAKNSRLGDKFRSVAAGPRLCKMFCGGTACKYCDYTRWRDNNQAIAGESVARR